LALRLLSLSYDYSFFGRGVCYNRYMLLTLSILATLACIFIFLAYSFISLRSREKQVEKKENAIDSNYHHVVDDALSKERKILDDATQEADQIITGAQYLTHNSKEEVHDAIRSLVADIQKEGATIAHTFTSEYTNSLNTLSGQSLAQFQTIMTTLESGLKKQIQDFHQSLLPQVEKELQEYKKARMQQIDAAVVTIVQKASQEIFNKSLPLADHQNIVIESLEKAKKEGVFD